VGEENKRTRQGKKYAITRTDECHTSNVRLRVSAATREAITSERTQKKKKRLKPGSQSSQTFTEGGERRRKERRRWRPKLFFETGGAKRDLKVGERTLHSFFRVRKPSTGGKKEKK